MACLTPVDNRSRQTGCLLPRTTREERQDRHCDFGDGPREPPRLVAGHPRIETRSWPPKMTTDSIEMLRSTPNPHDWFARSGQSHFMNRFIVALVTPLLVSAGLGCAALGPIAGIAHAGDFHWGPGDPPPQGVRFDGSGHAGQRVPIYPAWDTSVCHSYMIEGDHCGLPQFQWFQCPPGTTPAPNMAITPNKGE